MAIDVRMPKLSDNMEEGVIIRWMKAPGDQVTKGEPLAEVETDKADVELEASDSGVLDEIKVSEGESAAVGAVIAVLAPASDAAGDGGKGSAAARQAGSGAGRKSSDAEGDGASEKSQPGEPSARQEPDEPRPPSRRSRADAPVRERAAPAARSIGADARARDGAEVRKGEDEQPERGGAPSRRTEVARGRSSAAPSERTTDSPVRASPLAWRLAEDAGINLATVRGSGPGGRILQRDVEAQVRGPSRSAAEARGDDAVTRADAEKGEPTEARRSGAPRLIEASRMRRAIATRMAEAKREIPHFYVGAEIDMTEAVRLRASIKQLEAMPGLTLTHLLLRALALALVQHPRVNASWRDGAVELHDDVNIGIAVAVEDGLVVPVLHRAQTLTLAEVAARAAQLTEKARSGKFTGEELTGGTFSLSNVGMLDVDELVAVINPPQAAILAVGAVKDRPIVRDGRLAVGKTMRATLSCDHRVLNGVEGGRFLEALKQILENPVTLLLE